MAYHYESFTDRMIGKIVDKVDEVSQDPKAKKVSAPKVAAVAATLVLAVFLACTCVKVVDTGNVAVVTRFGEIVGVESNGVHFKTPFDRYNIINVTQQQVTAEYSTASKDNQSITQEITAQIVVNPEAAADLYAKFLGNHMEGIVAPILSDGFKAANAKFSLEETIEKRDELSTEMLAAVQDRLEPYGIQVVSVEIKNVALPEEYKAAVERQKVAERDQITAQVEKETAEIQAETNEILAESLSQENFTQMFLEKWNGILPTYMGDGDSLGMILPTTNNQ